MTALLFFTCVFAVSLVSVRGLLLMPNGTVVHHMTATFGPPDSTYNVTGQLIMAIPPDLCTTSTALADIIRGIPSALVLIRRGNCTFFEKCLTAQTLGAKAAIVINDAAYETGDSEYWLEAMAAAPQQSSGDIVIPSVLISYHEYTQFIEPALNGAVATAETDVAAEAAVTLPSVSLPSLLSLTNAAALDNAHDNSPTSAHTEDSAQSSNNADIITAAVTAATMVPVSHRVTLPTSTTHTAPLTPSSQTSTVSSQRVVIAVLNNVGAVKAFYSLNLFLLLLLLLPAFWLIVSVAYYGRRACRNYSRRQESRRVLNFLPTIKYAQANTHIEMNQTRIAQEQEQQQKHHQHNHFAKANSTPALQEPLLLDTTASSPTTSSPSADRSTPSSSLTIINTACSICLDDFRESEDVLLLPCRHGFHDKCARPWLRQTPCCPICRSSILNNSTPPNCLHMFILNCAPSAYEYLFNVAAVYSDPQYNDANNRAGEGQDDDEDENDDEDRRPRRGTTLSQIAILTIGVAVITLASLIIWNISQEDH